LRKKQPPTKKKEKRKTQIKGQHQEGQQRSTHIHSLDEKSHPIQRAEFPTGVLVGAGSCWPNNTPYIPLFKPNLNLNIISLEYLINFLVHV
jgi:hypothetical protein